ncbi:MAG: hypothetical protein KDD53_04160, partial [Bdellovibrionales bacterium]|nr:hypothetical protein [Bdellovibrionales bacterium]
GRLRADEYQFEMETRQGGTIDPDLYAKRPAKPKYSRRKSEKAKKRRGKEDDEDTVEATPLEESSSGEVKEGVVS